MLTIATANVNGIRAALKRGMGQWVETRSPDVLLLQEVRAPETLLGELFGADGWDLAHAESDAKGRAGVAIASRLPMTAVRINLDQGVESNTGRWVEADLEVAAAPGAPARTLTVVSAYLHSGTVGTPSMDEKYAFLELVTARLAEIAADGGLAVVAGDLNIAHRNVDLKNWKGNLRSAGFLPEERAYVDRWLGELGWHDLGRELGGEGPGPYTWWSWRGKAFDNDAGWRIDYQLATPALAGLARTAVVERAEAYDQRWSDHAPLVVEYDLSVHAAPSPLQGRDAHEPLPPDADAPGGAPGRPGARERLPLHPVEARAVGRRGVVEPEVRGPAGRVSSGSRR